MNTLYRRLEDYQRSDYYGFHMPGHKRNETLIDAGLPYGIDITEIEGFDDLHHADGILKEAQERGARVFGAKETHFLVNGSTVGILSAILGCTNRGDKVLVARHCHKSIYHSMVLNELKPVYLYPEFDSELQIYTEISVSAVKAALKEHSDIKAVVIVSPTYEGVISDVEAIAAAVHEKGIPLIVDQAHGAHFGFHPYFEENANRQGADVVIQSLHKTLPSLTQTALLHINGTLVSSGKIKRYLGMLQSSSPSYVLMASIDTCIDWLECGSEEVFAKYTRDLEAFWEQAQEWKVLRLLETEHFDRSKLVISVKDADITSRELHQILLERYHLQMEMIGGTYVLALSSVGDTKEGLDRLAAALLEIDTMIYKRIQARRSEDTENGRFFEEFSEQETAGARALPREEVENQIAPQQVLTPAFAIQTREEKPEETALLKWEESQGFVAMEYAYLYPPGSPLVVPGERICGEVIERLCLYRTLGFDIEGLQKEGYIEVWKNG